jgi:uncharacterized protein YbbC (DUF1343 family)
MARLVRARWLQEVELRVIPLRGWRRAMTYEETALPWVPPSPNMPSVESAAHYPGTCLFEGTNLSVGRGSDAPFQQVGAPWLDTAGVMADLRRAAPPGVRARAVRFTPTRPGDGKYADTLLAGIRLEVTDRAVYDPPATAVSLLSAIRRRHPGEFAWIPRHFDRLAGTSELRTAIDAGTDPGAIVRGWEPGRREFLERRRGVLLYPE